VLGDLKGHAPVGIAGKNHEVGMVRLHVGPSCYKDLNVAEISDRSKIRTGTTRCYGLGSERRLAAVFPKTYRPADTHHAGLSGVTRARAGRVRNTVGCGPQS
jgi:hypothetical protein